MMVTLLTPTSGTAIINGFDIVKEADGVRRSIGVIPQAMTTDLELSVEENLLIFAKLYGVPREKRQTADSASCSSSSSSRSGRTRRSRTCRAACDGASRSRAAWCTSRASSSSTSRRPASTPCRASTSGRCCERIKSERQLTILMTTHYMDEADKLCDRIAIVDHGELKALDSPMKLKSSVPSNNVLEVNFTSPPPGWAERLKALPDVEERDQRRPDVPHLVRATARRRRWRCSTRRRPPASP